MKKKILCLSRSYLSKLLPTISAKDSGREYFHVVQNTFEAKRVESFGGKVVVNVESLVKKVLCSDAALDWNEPEDFRKVTEFEWSPLYTDRYLLVMPEKIRLRVAAALYDGFEKLFRAYQFDYFISEPVALFTTHLIYYFCKKNDVRARFWVNCYFPEYFFFASTLDYAVASPRSLSASDVQKTDALIENFCRRVVEDKAGPAYHFSFAADLKRNLNYFKQRKGDASLVLLPGLWTLAMQTLRLSRALFYSVLFPWKGDFQSAASLKEHWFYFKCLLTPRRYYDSLPAASDDVVVFPLQYEPEASLLYAAPSVFNQVAFVESILRALPDKKVLYVKEHPNQFGALGMEAWRRLRAKYHNVRYIYGRESGRELIKASSLIVAISSTAGMDGVLLGKPVILAGRVFYNDYPNVTCIKGVDELPGLLARPPATLSSQEVLPLVVDKLKGLAGNSYLGDPQPSPVLYTEDNLNNLIAAIDQACR